jgi:hypothetical protein
VAQLASFHQKQLYLWISHQHPGSSAFSSSARCPVIHLILILPLSVLIFTFQTHPMPSDIPLLSNPPPSDESPCRTQQENIKIIATVIVSNTCGHKVGSLRNNLF